MKFDAFSHEAVNIADNNVELTVFSPLAIPGIGRIVGYQYQFDGDSEEQSAATIKALDIGSCSEERMTALTDYWSPRLGSEYF